MQTHTLFSVSNDIELLYSKTMNMIQSLMGKNRLIRRIRLNDSEKLTLKQFAKGDRRISRMMNSDADVHLIILETKPCFEIVAGDATLIIEPPKLREFLLRKQLKDLSGKKIEYKQKICRDHNYSNDFYNTQEVQEFKKDECTTLLEDKYETYPIQNQELIIEIIKKYLKKNYIDSYNMQLIDVRFYINSNVEIVIQYKINDDKLSLKEKVKRRFWSQILYSTRHWYGFQQIEELTLSLLEKAFLIDELQSRQQRETIYRVVESNYLFISNNIEIQLLTHKQNYWNILGIKPRTFESFKRFRDCVIVIIQNQHQLFFLNDEQIKTVLDQKLNSQYVKLVNDIKFKLKQLEYQIENRNYTIDSLILNEINKVTELVKEQKNLETVEQIINDLRNKKESMNQLQYQFDELNEILTEKKSQDEDNLLKYENVYKEYQRIYKQVLEKLDNYQGTNSLQKSKRDLKKIYNRILQEKRRVEQLLPIYTKKRHLIQRIQQQQVTLLVGETGSGKSTQLVQYIFEEVLQNGKVICVEPRQLAARQLARRVAEEMNTKLGEEVCYLTEFSEVQEKTKIVFTQDRIILNLMLEDSYLSDYEIVIIDEAHERTMNTDILLGLLKQLLSIRKSLKIIIMSATMDEQLFSNYFQCQIDTVLGKLYPIKIKYQDCFRDDYLDKIELLIYRKVIQKINNNTYFKRHVLVFLAGVDEINKMLQTFQIKYENQQIEYLGLHGFMANDEQFEVFRETNKVKIIFATRVAETALTINDVSVVIDIGVDRFIYFDQMRSMQVTKIGMISQAQANQRAGRAGRTSPGVCYRLYSEFDYINMQKYKIPEIQRCNLDSVVLKLKCFQVDVLNFDFIQKPFDQALLNSLQYLKDIQALDEEEKITPLGQLMAQIQTEPRMSRILIEAFYRNVFTDVLSIISVMLNNSTLYIRNTNIDTKIELLDESGDFMTFYKIYWQFKILTNQYTNHYIKQYCKDKGYHYKTLRVCENTFDEIYQTFSCFSEQLHSNQDVKRQILVSNNMTREDSIMTCFLKAFYPDICVYNGNPLIGYNLIRNNKNIRIYGTCALSLLNHYPKYIICTDLYSSQFDFCRVAQEVTLGQLEEVLNENQLKKIKDYIPKNYYFQELQNIPSSLMNHLMHKFSTVFEDNQFIQYCNIDRDQCKFQIWSKEKIDLEKEREEYQQVLKSYRYSKFYGQKMVVYFKHGCKVDKTKICPVSEFFEIQFLDCPFSTVQQKQILDQNQIKDAQVFEINVNQFGYSGLIVTHDSKIARQICDLLNQLSLKYNQEHQINPQQQDKTFFFIKSRPINNRIVKPTAEIRFYGCKNKGYGYITLKDQAEVEDFYEKIGSVLEFMGGSQVISAVQGEESELRIKDVPINADVKQLERYLSTLAQQMNAPVPQKVKLIPQKAKVQDWNQEIIKLFDKYMKEKPYISIHPDINNYQILVRVSAIQNPLKLEDMRKQIHLQNNVLGYSTVEMKIQYKIIKLLNSSMLEENKQIIEQIKLNIQTEYKFTDDHLMIFWKDCYLIIQGSSPQIVRIASDFLYGVTNGFIIDIQLQKKVFIDLLKNKNFSFELLALESKLNFKYNKQLLKKGKIQVYTENSKLGIIQKEINQLIQNQVSKKLCVDIKAYSFQPLLSMDSNILSNLSQEHKVTIDFSLSSKKLFIYGNVKSTLDCKEQLLQSLQKFHKGSQNICPICLSPIQGRFILALCGHAYCKGCLMMMMQEELKFPVVCPQSSCDISLQDIQQLMCETDYERVLNQSYQKYKETNPDKYVECKTRFCTEFFEKIPNSKPQFYYCESCLNSFCNDCSLNAHINMTCEEAQKNSNADSLLTIEQMEELGIKQCPKCKNKVQKVDGCNHMHCKICKTHFCWVCLFPSEEQDPIYLHMNKKNHNAKIQ